MKQTETDPPGKDAETVLMAHADALYAYALGRLRDPGRAEEAVQETLLAALAARDSATRFRGDSALKSWLTGILRHKVMDQLRDQSRTLTVGDMQETLEQAQFDSHGRWRIKPGEWPTPEAAAEQHELGQALSRCINALPNPAASVFVFTELDGIAGAEICNKLGLSATHYRVILYRARLALRRCLEGLGVKGVR